MQMENSLGRSIHRPYIKIPQVWGGWAIDVSISTVPTMVSVAVRIFGAQSYLGLHYSILGTNRLF